MALRATQRNQLAQIALMQVSHFSLRRLDLVLIDAWVHLMHFLITACEDGQIDLSFPGAMALLARRQVFVDETLMETYIETYAKTQLITWNAETRVLGLPDALQPSRRAVASRENGKKGGRPRKNAHVTPQTDPRQRSIIMPIGGGKSMSEKTYETQQVPETGDKLSLACTESTYDQAKLDALFGEVGPKAFEAAGFDPARDMPNWGVCRQWCADGLKAGLSDDEITRLVVSVVAGVAERQRERNNPPAHMGYFTRAVTTAIANRDVPSVAQSVDDMRAERAWAAAMSDYTYRRSCGENPTRPVLEDYLAEARAKRA